MQTLCPTAGQGTHPVEGRRLGNDNTIGCTLKNTLKPHLQRQWVIPPDANAAFVANMEDVLEGYHRPHDPEYPWSAWTRHQSN
jgi:hypothetical protein